MNDSASLEDIAAWLHDADPLAAPGVEEKARFILLDTLGCFIAAQGHQEPAAMARGFTELEPGKVKLPGLEGGLSPTAAAFLIALGACWDEACEGLARAHGRPGLHAMPAALALALADERDLASLLRALVVGYEVGGRMGESLRIKPGMHVDGAWGALAAAAAAAALLSGEAATTITAVNTAACQIPFSLYAPVAAGASARNTYCGHGVTLGMQAALAAQAGIGAPRDALAQYNQIALGAEAGATQFASAGEFFILEGYLKPFAAVRHVHYGAAAALEWRAARGPDTGAISALGLSVYDEAIRYCGNRAPRTPIQAQFSLSYGIACALVTGELGAGAYRADVMGDAELRRLEALLEIGVDDARSNAGRRGATLTIATAAGTEGLNVDSVPGDPERPFDASRVRAKFESYAAPRLGQAHSARLASAILDGPGNVPVVEILQ